MRTVNLEKRAHVRSLLATGRLSYREVARVARVSRGLVSAVVHNRPIKALARRTADDDESPDGLLVGPARRCPRCHCLAKLLPSGECLACRDRAALAKLRRCGGRSPAPMREVLYELALAAQAPLGLDLREDDRQRYEQVRHRQLPLFDLDPMPWELDEAG